MVCAGALALLDPHASWTFFERALCIDFDADNSTNAEEGLHLGAMAGTLDVLQRHYLGLHSRGDALLLAPAPPPGLGQVWMRMQHRDAFLAIDWDGAVLRLRANSANFAPLPVLHAGHTHLISPGEDLTIEPECRPGTPLAECQDNDSIREQNDRHRG